MANKLCIFDRNNEEDLTIYLEQHFCYEVEMFIHANNKIIEFQDHNQNDMNMAVECLCLHMRNLVAFLFYKRAENYNSSDYYISEENWKALNNNKNLYDDLIGLINNKVSHLDFNRNKEESDNTVWKSDEIFLPLLRDVKMFCDFLPDKYLVERVKIVKFSIANL